MKRLIFNEAMRPTTGRGRHLRPGALLIIYINVVRGAKRLWGETSMGRNVLPWGEVYMGRKVHKSLLEDEDERCLGSQVSAHLQHR